MQLSDLVNLVVEATGRSDKTALIKSGINLAIEEISVARLWSDLQTTGTGTVSAGSPYLDLESDVTRVEEARIIDGTSSRSLLVRPKSWLLQRVPDPSSRSHSRPCYAYLEGLRLYMIPYPDVDYTVSYTYYKKHPTLTADSDETLIRGIDGAVAAYAAFWVFNSIEKAEDANRWYQTFMARLESAKRLDAGNSVVKREATPTQGQPYLGPDYWLDPFIRRMP